MVNTNILSQKDGKTYTMPVHKTEYALEPHVPVLRKYWAHPVHQHRSRVALDLPVQCDSSLQSYLRHHRGVGHAGGVFLLRANPLDGRVHKWGQILQPLNHWPLTMSSPVPDLSTNYATAHPNCSNRNLGKGLISVENSHKMVRVMISEEKSIPLVIVNTDSLDQNDR